MLLLLLCSTFLSSQSFPLSTALPPLSPLSLQIRSLEADARYNTLYQLVTIFASKDLQTYLQFATANAAFLAGLGVEHSRSVETMRLLTLVSMGASSSSISYADIAGALQVSKKRKGGKRGFSCVCTSCCCCCCSSSLWGMPAPPFFSSPLLSSLPPLLHMTAKIFMKNGNSSFVRCRPHQPPLQGGPGSE